MALKNLLNFDLGRLPLLSWWNRAWRTAPFAHSGVRRQAKALLFRELDAALRQGVPLERALAFASREMPQSKASRGLSGILGHLVAFWIALLGSLNFLVFSMEFQNVARVVRVLALRLHEHVAGGQQLSQAMLMCEPDYDKQEIALAEMGERGGRLPQALRGLVEFQATESKHFHHRAKLLYPALLLMVMLIIAFFLLTKIMPKFQDIYMQLGATSLPTVSDALVNVSIMIANTPWFLPLALILGLLIFVRLIINGSPLTRRVVAYTLVAAIVLIIARTAADLERNDWFLLLSGLLAGLAILPFIFAGLERLVIRAEEGLRGLLRFGPARISPLYAEQEARFLAMFALMLESGLPEHEAMRLSGASLRGKFRTRAAEAAARIERGMPVGRAALDCNLFSKRTNNKLAFLDGGERYLERLRLMARDISSEADEVTIRYGWAVEVLAVMACGAIALFIALAFYMPLFRIPAVLMNLE